MSSNKLNYQLIIIISNRYFINNYKALRRDVCSLHRDLNYEVQYNTKTYITFLIYAAHLPKHIFWLFLDINGLILSNVNLHRTIGVY